MASHRVALRYLASALAANLALAGDISLAQSETGFDEAIIQDCRNGPFPPVGPTGETVVAASRYGHITCDTTILPISPKTHLEKTLQDCDARLSPQQRQIAPCEVLFFYGASFDSTTSRALYQGGDIPVEYRMRYGDRRRTVTHHARLRFLNEYSFGSARAVEIVAQNGRQLCKGHYSVRRDTSSLTLTCGSHYQLHSGPIKPSGYIDQNGMFLPQFETELKETLPDPPRYNAVVKRYLVLFPHSPQLTREKVIKRGLKLTLRTVP